MISSNYVRAGAFIIILSIAAQLHADPVPASPVPPPVPPVSTVNSAAAAQAFCDSVGGMLAGTVMTWDYVTSGKPSFPFVVDRIARQAQASANATTQANQRNVTRLLTNEQFVKGQLMLAVGEHGGDPAKLNPAAINAVHQRLVAFCGRIGNFYAEGTICYVGFGSGDHESRQGYVPVGPKTLTRRLFTAEFTSWLATQLN